MKLRLWDKEENKLYSYEDLVSSLKIECRFSDNGLYFVDTGRVDEDGYDYELDVEILRPTGLNDINGTPIYEGDIVVKEGYIWLDNGKPNYRGTVEWIYSQWQVIAHCVNPEKQGIANGTNEGLNDDGFEDGENSDWEVIGNIHQHPHLLTKE